MQLTDRFIFSPIEQKKAYLAKLTTPELDALFAFKHSNYLDYVDKKLPVIINAIDSFREAIASARSKGDMNAVARFEAQLTQYQIEKTRLVREMDLYYLEACLCYTEFNRRDGRREDVLSPKEKDQFKYRSFEAVEDCLVRNGFYESVRQS